MKSDITITAKFNGIAYSLRVQASPEAVRGPCEDSAGVYTDEELANLFRLACRDNIQWLHQAHQGFCANLLKYSCEHLQDLEKTENSTQHRDTT